MQRPLTSKEIERYLDTDREEIMRELKERVIFQLLERIN